MSANTGDDFPMISGDALNAGKLKARLRSGDATCGAFLQLSSHLSAEILSRAGFDWLIVDMEHAPIDLDSLLRQLQAIGYSSKCTPFVRAPWNDAVSIKRILDAGAQGIVIPYVNTAEEARNAVAACKYPPEGIRGAALSPRAAGFGQSDCSFFERSNAEIIVIVSIETVEAVQNLDAILQIGNLDGIFIGPMDLAVSMGHAGDSECDEVQQVIAEIESKVLASDKFLGTVATNWEKADRCISRGYQWLILMQDSLTLASRAAHTVQKFRNQVLDQSQSDPMR